VLFITEHPNSKLELISLNKDPKIRLEYDKRSTSKEPENIALNEFISVKGLAAQGNRLTAEKIKTVDLVPLTEEEQQAEEAWLNELKAKNTQNLADSDDDVEDEDNIQPTLF
jgi:topoisomerase-4 subunit A